MCRVSLTADGGDGGRQAKEAEKAKKEEIEAEKKRIREVNVYVSCYMHVWL